MSMSEAIAAVVYRMRMPGLHQPLTHEMMARRGRVRERNTGRYTPLSALTISGLLPQMKFGKPATLLMAYNTPMVKKMDITSHCVTTAPQMSAIVAALGCGLTVYLRSLQLNVAMGIKRKEASPKVNRMRVASPMKFIFLFTP